MTNLHPNTRPYGTKHDLHSLAHTCANLNSNAHCQEKQGTHLQCARGQAAEVEGGDEKDYNVNNARCDTIWKCFIVTVDMGLRKVRVLMYVVCVLDSLACVCAR